MDESLNVVETTLRDWQIAEGKLDGYLMLQNLVTEGILIIVNEQDRVFEYQLGEFRNLLSSTAEYIKSLL